MQKISLQYLIKHPAASSGVLTALLQFAGFQPAFAPMGGELNPQRLTAIFLFVIVASAPSTKSNDAALAQSILEKTDQP